MHSHDGAAGLPEIVAVYAPARGFAQKGQRSLIINGRVLESAAGLMQGVLRGLDGRFQVGPGCQLARAIQEPTPAVNAARFIIIRCPRSTSSALPAATSGAMVAATNGGNTG